MAFLTTPGRFSISVEVYGGLFMRPRHVKIKTATEYGGDSRATLYVKAKQHPGLFVKDG